MGGGAGWAGGAEQPRAPSRNTVAVAGQHEGDRGAGARKRTGRLAGQVEVSDCPTVLYPTWDAGSEILTVAPGPSGTMLALPPWASAIARTMARPSPVPPRVRAESPRVKRSKARSPSCGGKPRPESATSSSAAPSTARERSTTSPSP